MQLYAPDNGREGARNMLSHTRTSNNQVCGTVELCWLTYLNRTMMHGLANVKSVICVMDKQKLIQCCPIPKIITLKEVEILKNCFL